MSSYLPKRHEWAIKVQEKSALPIYKEVWQGCEIEEVDKIGMEGNDFAKRRDFSGLDKIVLFKGNEIHIAQRFRGRYPRRNSYDFSLRYITPGLEGSKNAEYFKLIEAYKQDLWFPNKYVWGVTKTENPESGFDKLYIYNVRKFIKAVVDGYIKSVGVYSNGDGSKGIYFRLDDMKPFIEWECPPKQPIIKTPNEKDILRKQATLESFLLKSTY